MANGGTLHEYPMKLFDPVRMGEIDAHGSKQTHAPWRRIPVLAIQCGFKNGHRVTCTVRQMLYPGGIVDAKHESNVIRNGLPAIALAANVLSIG